MGGRLEKKKRDFERAKNRVLAWCRNTWFCYTYWEHQCVLVHGGGMRTVRGIMVGARVGARVGLSVEVGV